MSLNSCEQSQSDIYKEQKETFRYKVFDYGNSSFTES